MYEKPLKKDSWKESEQIEQETCPDDTFFCLCVYYWLLQRIGQKGLRVATDSLWQSLHSEDDVGIWDRCWKPFLLFFLSWVKACWHTHKMTGAEEERKLVWAKVEEYEAGELVWSMYWLCLAYRYCLPWWPPVWKKKQQIYYGKSNRSVLRKEERATTHRNESLESALMMPSVRFRVNIILERQRERTSEWESGIGSSREKEREREQKRVRWPST